MLENAVSATSLGHVAGISIAIAGLVVILLLGGILAVRLGFFSKRDEDYIGPLAPSDKGYLDRKLHYLNHHSRDISNDEREYAETESEESYRNRPSGHEEGHRPQGRPAA